MDIAPRRNAQSSWLGPLIFIVLIIDNLRLAVLTHNFLDDKTVSEIVAKNTVSEMRHGLHRPYIHALIEWYDVNHVNVNNRKTKEMVLDHSTRSRRRHFS